jgi:hypothetical protein
MTLFSFYFGFPARLRTYDVSSVKITFNLSWILHLHINKIHFANHDAARKNVKKLVRSSGVLIAVAEGLEMPFNCLPYFQVAYVQQLCSLCAGWPTAAS